MYLVSSCLAGINCRYNGSNSVDEDIKKLVEEGKAIPVCPEVFSGLKIPRQCCEIVICNGEKKVLTEDGKDLTKEFLEGAKKTLDIAKILNVEKAILQSRSPSCGYGTIYDGTFTGNLIEGYGFTAKLLEKEGIKIYTENNFKEEKW